MKIELKVKDIRYSGCENVTITKSVQSIAHTCAMDIYNGDAVNFDDDDLVQIIVDDKVFMTGYVDSIDFGISDTKKP